MMTAGAAQPSPNLYRALATARALVEAGRATGVLVQDSTVYVENGICAGCGLQPYPRPILVDEPNQGNPWCPGCGGRALVVLETGDTNFDNGLVRLTGARTVHLIAPPVGTHPLCMPGARVGRMQAVPGNDAEPTCKRCLAARAARTCTADDLSETLQCPVHNVVHSFLDDPATGQGYPASAS